MMPHFQNPNMLFLLLLLPVAVALFVMAERRRREALRRFAGSRGEAQGLLRDRRFEFCCFALSIWFIIFALARPAWRQVPEDVATEGRDLVFLLDVSRSMLAGDLTPNRLETAKRAIRDCVDALDGDRVGLVAFAGSSSILCPLTTDYGFFYDKLEEVHPEIVDQGGTRIGDAIRKTADKLLSDERSGLQDVILFSDGGDQESRPEQASAELDKLGVYFVVIGIGDALSGARIPARTDDEDSLAFTMYQGREVWSRLEAASLEKLARACRHGVFLNAGTRALPLGEVYTKLVSHFRRQTTGQTDTMMRYVDTFPAFLAAGLLLLVPPFLRWGRGKSAMALLAVSAVLGSNVEASSPRQTYNQGCKQFDAKNYTGAMQSFMSAAEEFPDSERRALAIYNAGNSSYRQAEADSRLDPQTSLTYYRQAVRSYRSVLEMRPDFEEAAWNLELALRRRMQTEERLEKEGKEPPQDEEGEEQQEEGDPSDSESESEEMDDYEPSEDDQATEPSDQSKGENAMNMENQDIPPPMVDPEDIFQQEAANNEVREKTKGAKYKPVEKDW